MEHATLKAYITGFALSLLLTLAAYLLVVTQVITGSDLIIVILACAVIQFIVQAFFFLHLGQEAGPRWNLVIFLSTLGIVLLLVVGSIWIMSNLNYRMMASPTEMNTYIDSQDGL